MTAKKRTWLACAVAVPAVLFVALAMLTLAPVIVAVCVACAPLAVAVALLGKVDKTVKGETEETWLDRRKFFKAGQDIKAGTALAVDKTTGRLVACGQDERSLCCAGADIANEEVVVVAVLQGNGVAAFPIRRRPKAGR